MNTTHAVISSHLDDANKIAIVGHYNPDGDALGACMGLYHFLTNEKKEVQVIMPNAYPENLSWLDPENKIINYQLRKAEADDFLKTADILFCLDFQSLNRTDKMEAILTEIKPVKILIDHHLDPNFSQFDVVYSLVQVSSTCELVYRVLNSLDSRGSIDKVVASCLYAGICTDTGSFSYSCGHSEVFSTVSNLIDCGIDVVQIHREIFDTFSEQRLRLLGYCLSHRLVVVPEYETAYIYLSKEELDTYNYQAGDTEGIVNYPLSMKNIRFAAFFTERDSRIRISFRSKGHIDVNQFAKDYFNGGGHKNASGGNSFEGLTETVDKFVSLLPEFYKLFAV